MLYVTTSIKVDTLDTGDVAMILRRALGRMRANWSDFLSDCIRDKTSLAGLQLLPIVKVKTPNDRCKRPRYTAQAIKEFIVGVLMVIPRPSEAEREWQMVTIEFDPEMLKLPFSARRAKVATDVLSVPPVPAEHHTRS